MMIVKLNDKSTHAIHKLTSLEIVGKSKCLISSIDDILNSRNDSRYSLMIGENTMTYLYLYTIFPHLVSCFCKILNHEHKAMMPIISHMNIKTIIDRVLCSVHPYFIS